VGCVDEKGKTASEDRPDDFGDEDREGDAQGERESFPVEGSA
jgi:hypothetical protein